MNKVAEIEIIESNLKEVVNMDSSVDMDIMSSEIGLMEQPVDIVNQKASGKISSVVILGIVITVCVALGIVLGILAGKRSANK